jgi:hypothetical protein
MYNAGGIVGQTMNLSSITEASFTGNLHVVNTGNNVGCAAGGITGYPTESNITSCYASAVIEATAPAATVQAGGIAGMIRSNTAGQGVITACYAWVLVKADGIILNNAGGIAGIAIGSTSEVKGSYARGRVEAVSTANAYAGGIAGDTGGVITGCIALNDRIEVSTSSTDVRGIAGQGSGSHSNNYAANDITFTRAGFSTNTGLTGDITKFYADFIGQANQSNYSGWTFPPNGDWRWISGYDYPVLVWQASAPRNPATL